MNAVPIVPHDPGAYAEGLRDLIPRHAPDLRVPFDALREGRIVLRRCSGCRRTRYPAGPVCPYCSDTAWTWDDVPGTGVVHTWIRYRRSYLAAFEHLVPYCVVCVQLDDGPRLFGRWIGEREPVSGQRVRPVIEQWPTGDCTTSFTGETE
ncbi:Zn-ribbon domain-containing OB-fold protein [Streptomyces specialis]|uniref:Zn-ribbon domain-containing OB-fold protein n=1 Tax=Streptomyces specialis TaxID=498367 RepID=UPI00073F74B6|nr:OB-fold domain-containing protein [Streptomyces specialis]